MNIKESATIEQYNNVQLKKKNDRFPHGLGTLPMTQEMIRFGSCGNLGVFLWHHVQQLQQLAIIVYSVEKTFTQKCKVLFPPRPDVVVGAKEMWQKITMDLVVKGLTSRFPNYANYEKNGKSSSISSV